VELAEKCPNVCVYASGKLVGGTEPDGTTPEKTYTVAHLVRLYQELMHFKPFTDEATAELFDLNSDKTVDIYDAALLKRELLKN
jgi:hypothetical protein